MADVEVAADVDRMRGELEGAGYVEVVAHKTLTAGSRIHHVGERFWEAARDGTAVVVGVFHHPTSPWEKSYGRPDIEVIVMRDKPLLEGMSPVSQWADYHCVSVLVAEATR